MISLNKVILIGRITKDILINQFAQGDDQRTRANFTVAIDRRQSRNKTADFINCVAFGQPAEFLKSYAIKGTQIQVEGSIQSRSFQDKEGNTRYVTEVMCERVSIQSNQPRNAAPKANTDDTDEEYVEEFNPSETEEDLPF